MMKMFAFDPAQYRDEFRTKGWVHIKNAISPEFLASLREFVTESLGEHRLEEFAIKGKKEQALYEFPDDVDYPGELFDSVASLCGLNRSNMTLSERHIQAYEANAAPEPAAHKDRLGSQIAVGFSIDVPKDSRLVIYPFDQREINPLNSSAAYRRSLRPEALPEVSLKSATEVEIDDDPGDIVVFRGSTTWHLRRNSAGTVNLYLKLNDFRCDPLGDDPFTSEHRARTLAALASADEEQLNTLIPVVSRRLDAVTRQYTRNNWQEVLWANLYGEEAFGLTEAEFALLQRADGDRTFGELVADFRAGGVDAATVQSNLRWLVERGALDLLLRSETPSLPHESSGRDATWQTSIRPSVAMG